MAKLNPLTFELRQVNQSNDDRGPIGSTLASVAEELQKLRLHVSQLAAAHGAALTAVLEEHLVDVELRLHGAERSLAGEFGAIQRMLDAAVQNHGAALIEGESIADALGDVLVELDRRDRRSGRKPSREAAKARKALDQYLLDRGA